MRKEERIGDAAGTTRSFVADQAMDADAYELYAAAGSERLSSMGVVPKLREGIASDAVTTTFPPVPAYAGRLNGAKIAAIRRSIGTGSQAENGADKRKSKGANRSGVLKRKNLVPCLSSRRDRGFVERRARSGTGRVVVFRRFL